MIEKGQAVSLEIGDHRFLAEYVDEGEAGHHLVCHVHLVASTGMRDGEWWVTGGEGGEPEYEYRGPGRYRFPAQTTVVGVWPHELPMRSV